MKWLLRIVGIVVILIIIAVGVVWFMLDSIAQTAIERGGTYALQVETKCGGASVRPFAGKFGVSQVSIANPEGFRSEQIMVLQTLDVDANMGSLTSDVVEVPSIVLDGMTVNIEQEGGKNNLSVLLEKIQGQKQEEEQTPEQAPPGKKVDVGVLLIRNVEAKVQLLPIGGEATDVVVKVPEIRLEHPTGEDARGATVAELMRRIVPAVFAAIIEKGGDVLPADFVTDVLDDVGSLASQLGGEAANIIGQVGGDVGKVLEGAVEGLGGVGEGTGKAVEDLGKGVGDALKSLTGEKQDGDQGDAADGNTKEDNPIDKLFGQ